MQALYAFFHSENDRIEAGEKQLLTSIDKIYDLYIYQLTLLLEVVRFANRRIEEGKQKFLPTEEDLNPNTRFIDNKVAAQLLENRDLQRKADGLKINWGDEEELIRRLYNEVKASEVYQKYMEQPESSYKADKEILIEILRCFIAPNDVLLSYFEEINIHWAHDYDMGLVMAVKTLSSYKESYDEYKTLPALFKSSMDGMINEDRYFVLQLYRKVILKSDQYEDLIDIKLKNWELERIADMDVILIKMALAEFIEFQSIPLKVSLNEYIDLSKEFSTPKSKVFINGILDKMVCDLKADEVIVKTGRGLIE